MTRAQICLYHIAENMRLDKSIGEEGYKYFQQAIKALQAEPCEDAVSRKAINELFNSEIKMYAERIEARKGSNYHDETERIKEFRSRIANAEYWQDKIKALPSATPTQRWTPCSERLPKERGMYIVTEKVFSVTDKEHAGGFNLMTEQVEFDNGKWRRASFYEVIAWMPLLKPYQEESEET